MQYLTKFLKYDSQDLSSDVDEAPFAIGRMKTGLVEVLIEPGISELQLVA